MALTLALLCTFILYMDETFDDCSYIAYIDEAGDAGNKVGHGSSEVIVMAAVILPAWRVDLADELFDHAHALRKGKTAGRQFKKFSEGNEHDNYLLTGLFSFFDITICQVMFHKPTMGQAWTRLRNREEYCYLCKLAIERISWFVRQTHHPNDPGNGKCALVFSENRAFPYPSIYNYIQKLKYGHDKYNCSAHWNYIYTNFRTQKHQNETAIHLADIAASALYRACEPRYPYGMTDDRFQRNLLGSLARRDRTVYGFKLFPSPARQVLEASGHLDFLRLL
jgi:hypothetical protein